MLGCEALTVGGTFTGVSSLQAEITLSGCVLKKAKGMLAAATPGPCQSEGATAGTITTGPLTAGLGIAFTKVAKLGGWALGTVSTTVSCGSFQFRLSGSQIAVAAPVNLSVASSTWRFEGKKAPESLSGRKTSYRLFVEPRRLEQRTGLSIRRSEHHRGRTARDQSQRIARSPRSAPPRSRPRGAGRTSPEEVQQRLVALLGEGPADGVEAGAGRVARRSVAARG